MITRRANTLTDKCMAAGNIRSRSLEIILGLLPLVLGFQLIIWIAYLPTALGGDADFRNFYSAGLILRSGRGHQLYDYPLQRDIQNAAISPASMVLPYVHLPYEALLFAPFTLLSYRSAFLCFLSLNVVLLFISYRLLQGRLWRALQMWRWFPLLFFVGYPPATATLLQGQDSILTLLLFCAGLTSLDSKNDLKAGLFVGLGLYKFQLILPILGLFLLWRRWRFMAGASISVLGVLAVSVAVSGVGGLFQYVTSLRDISTKFTAGNQVLYVMPIAKMPNIRGMIMAIPNLPSALAVHIVIVVSVVMFAAAAWVGIKASAQWQLALGICTAALTGYHVLMHDLSILLIPMVMLQSRLISRRLWAIPMVWLSTLLCFLGYEYLVTLVLLLFFLVLFSLVHNSNKPDGTELARKISVADLPRDLIADR